MSAPAEVQSFEVTRGGSQAAAPDCRRRTRTVREAAAILGVGKTSIYEAIGRGEVRAIRLARRLVIPEAEIERLLAGG